MTEPSKMTSAEAAAIRDRLGLTNKDISADLSKLTGSNFGSSTVSAWFRDRAPSVTCAVYLRMRAITDLGEDDIVLTPTDMEE